MDFQQTKQSRLVDTRHVTALQYHDTTPSKSKVVTDDWFDPSFAEAVCLYSQYELTALHVSLEQTGAHRTRQSTGGAPATGRRDGQMGLGGIDPKTETSVCKSFQWN